jgi:GH35 family endo-1,4-beta-xylanase
MNPMREAYWRFWNADVQARIDEDIERYRKADAVLRSDRLPVGTEVKIEQVSHDFVFGAHIFNFNQLGSEAANRRYEALYGTLFNSATIAFYWKTFEMAPDQPRFGQAYRDTEEFWNQVEEPKSQPHWRRPAPDPVVAFCERNGVRMHGHPIIWGNRRWHYPEWIVDEFCPADEKAKLSRLGADELAALTPAQLAEMLPVFARELNRLFDRRVVELAEHYGDRIDSWDVVNESAVDMVQGCLVPGTALCHSRAYGLMPGDYPYKAFTTAHEVFPPHVLLNINDYMNTASYADGVIELLNRGCKIDVIGSQMHLFDPQRCLDIADGEKIKTPEQIGQEMRTISRAGLPIHLSEITVTAPGDDARGREIQATIARNLYRLWFSVELMMGITWWNVVDDCGAPGEPTTSGLFTRAMEPKPSYHALDQLINAEWKTRTTVRVGDDGAARFRGFKGRYRLTWHDAFGQDQEAEFYLQEDGAA